MKKIFSCLILVALISGCANPNQKRNEQVVNNATEALKYCMESQRSQGKKAECAQNFYGALGAVSDDDYGKLPALRMATALYALLVKVDRRQINESDAKMEFMKIANDFQSDLSNAQRLSNAENRAAAMQQQQMFMNAQRLLSPPGSVVNCFRAPGSPVTSCY
jgi:PBP1b-binding outer membrane lipoprotein LpoB